MLKRKSNSSGEMWRESIHGTFVCGLRVVGRGRFEGLGLSARIIFNLFLERARGGVKNVSRIKLRGFEIFTAVTTKSAIFRDGTPCNLVEAYRRYVGNILPNYTAQHPI
jgi:hypothetical protein